MPGSGAVRQAALLGSAAWRRMSPGRSVQAHQRLVSLLAALQQPGWTGRGAWLWVGDGRCALGGMWSV